MPTIAHLVKESGMIDVPISEVRLGDKVLVKPSENISVDEMVVEGASSVNEALVTRKP